jgi:hypothetical protein
MPFNESIGETRCISLFFDIGDFRKDIGKEKGGVSPGCVSAVLPVHKNAGSFMTGNSETAHAPPPPMGFLRIFEPKQKKNAPAYMPGRMRLNSSRIMGLSKAWVKQYPNLIKIPKTSVDR